MGKRWRVVNVHETEPPTLNPTWKMANADFRRTIGCPDALSNGVVITLLDTPDLFVRHVLGGLIQIFFTEET